MKVRYFEDTDTLYIELREGVAADSRDIDENTLVDIDEHGEMLAITVEHATQRAELSQFLYERVTA
jgi:uncharacterized protein YuzE